MKKIIIFGNSGSGKSTLAKQLVAKYGIAHLDLDTLAWLDSAQPIRRPLEDSKEDMVNFMSDHKEWVIEGCYGDLLDFAIEASNEIIFMNLSVEKCIINARNRPWEKHKYKSKKEQDSNLVMLIEWIKQYENRLDTFSKKEHMKIYDDYVGLKKMISENTSEIHR